MKCFEYEGKKIFKKFGIPVPQGRLINSEEEAVVFFNNLQNSCVIKAQVLSGKRGKAGGIKFADNISELKNNFNKVKNMKIYGEKVSEILVEEKISIEQELYLGITIDPGEKIPVLIFSLEGGMDIEEIAEKYPEKIIKTELKENMHIYNYYDILGNLNMSNELIINLSKVINKLVKLFFAVDATTVEINPLVLTDKKDILAADSKLVIDDSALFRQKELGLKVKDELKSDLEKRAKRYELNYVSLDKSGNIGSIAGGAGLAMATMDTIRYCGGQPANFLDIGGGVSESNMAEALKIVASQKNVEGIIVNVFGGINNCEFMAKGIKRAIEENKIEQKIVVKMRGHFQEEGWKILDDLNIPTVKYDTTKKAVKILLDKLKEGA